MSGKLSIKGFTLASAVLWGGAVFLVGICNRIWPGYAGTFLELIASVYPGYHASASVASILVGAGYAFLDGAIGGAIFAWLYNRFAK